MGKAKHGPALDRRDKRLFHAIWLTVTEALEAQREGHTHKWGDVQKALDKAEDEMGPPEDYDPTL